MHDPRLTLSQVPQERNQLSQSSDRSALTVPAYLDSSMQMLTALENELCENPNCYGCTKARWLGIDDINVYVGNENPHFDMEFEEIELVSFYNNFAMPQLTKLFFQQLPVPEEFEATVRVPERRSPLDD